MFTWYNRAVAAAAAAIYSTKEVEHDSSDGTIGHFKPYTNRKYTDAVK